jgi:hypothetical protein
MIHKFVLASLCVTTTLATAVSPAYAGGWVYRGPAGATVAHWGQAPVRWASRPYPYGGAVAAGVVAGVAVGAAVAAIVPRPAYVVAPPVVYAPPVAYVAPLVIYSPPLRVYYAP